MASLLGGGTNAQQPTIYTGLQIQTSAQGVCIAIVWGTNVLAPNLVWQGDFTKTPVSGKGGKGGGAKGAGQYTYSEAVILALCEGPIEGTNDIWSNGTPTGPGALNMALSTGSQTQTPPAWMESNFPSQALSYAGTAYFFSSSMQLGSSATLPSLTIEVVGFNFGQPGFPYFADIMVDYLTNPQYGVVGFPAGAIDPISLEQFRIYCQAQNLVACPALTTQEQGITTLQRWTALANTWVFWSGAQLKFVPLATAAVTGYGTTFTPNTTPVYDLGPDDFIFDEKSEAPVTVTRLDPADGYNRVELDVRDRTNQYEDTPVYWEDQATIDQFGLLQSNTISAPEITDVGVAAVMATLIGQRCVYLRNTYSFKLPYNFILLETGDLVTLTEPNLGLVAFPVRIKTVDEADNMLLSVTAEEFTAGVGPPLFPRPQQAAAGQAGPDRLVDPGDVNVPMIYEPSLAVTVGTPQIWIGASGGADWGGADAFLSSDGTNYSWIGRINAVSQQGTLTAVLPLELDPDLIDTLAIDTAECQIPISASATDAAADAFQTALLIDEEVVCYGSVDTTGTFTAGLTYLRRGCYGTGWAAHSIGAQATRINPATVLQYDLPAAYVGILLYLKLTSFNSFGAMEQDLSDVVAYEYAPQGVGYTIAPPTSPSLFTSSVLQPDGATIVSMYANWHPSAGPALGSNEIQWTSNGGASWAGDTLVPGTTSSYALAPALSGAFYQFRVRSISQSGQAISAWLYSAVVEAVVIPPGPGTVPSTEIPLPSRPPSMPRPAPEGEPEPNPRIAYTRRPTATMVAPLTNGAGQPVTDASGQPVGVPLF